MANERKMETGTFGDPSYISVGDPYKGKRVGVFNEAAYKGKQMIPGIPKAGTFNKFERLLEGEAYHDPVKLRRQEQLKDKTKIKATFIPPSGQKSTGGAGNFHGTFGGKMEAMKAGVREQPKRAPEPRNFTIKPPKKGTGYGYAGVTIGTGVSYAAEPFDCKEQASKKKMEEHKALMAGKRSYTTASFEGGRVFEKNPFGASGTDAPPPKDPPPKPAPVLPFKPSKPPGRMDGSGKFFTTFDKYPEHPSIKEADKVPKEKEKVFKPTSGPKSSLVTSIRSMSIKRSVNQSNFRSMVV